jgi:hypothetical protein
MSYHQTTNQGFGQAAYDTFGPGSQPQPQAAASGTSAVLTGVAQVIAPLAQLGVGIYSAKMQADFQKKQLKAIAKEAAVPYVMPHYRPAPVKSKLPLVLGILGGVTVLSLIVVIASRGKKKGGE